MAERKPYVCQYRMPVGLDNPPINLPYADKPEIIHLTEDEVEQAKQMLPDLKIFPAEEAEDPEEAMAEATSSDEPAEQEEPESEGETEEETETEEEEKEEEESSEDESSEEESEEEEDDLHYLKDDEDFPEAEKLSNYSGEEYPGGLVTVEAVIAFKKKHNLDDINGIGSAKSDKITDYIIENYPDLLDDEE